MSLIQGKTKMRVIGLTTVGVAALLAGTSARAQTVGAGEISKTGSTQPSRTTVYDAAFFAQYAPRTALDIVERVPGFTL